MGGLGSWAGVCDFLFAHARREVESRIVRAWRDFSRRGTLEFLYALVPVVFGAGCISETPIIVEVSNFTTTPVVVELTQYEDFYGKRPTEFTHDLLRDTQFVAAEPGETIKVAFAGRYEWVVWRQVEPAVEGAEPGVFSLYCDCREVILGQKTWREVTPGEWGARAYRLLARPVGYLAAVWFVLLFFSPRWALSRRWSPFRAAVSRPMLYYRLLAVVALMVLCLFVLVPQPFGIVAHVVRFLILLAAVPIFTVWWLASAGRVLLPRSALESDSWFGRGFPGFQRRVVSARAASFATLLIAAISTWTAFYVANDPLSTRVEPNLAPYESFYALPLAEQRRTIHDYPLDEQIDVYLAGERKCRGSELEGELALKAPEIVPLLAERLAKMEAPFEGMHMLDLLAWLEGSGIYPVADDEEFMRVLDRAAGPPDEMDWYLERTRVTEIHEHGERRRAAASVESRGPVE